MIKTYEPFHIDPNKVTLEQLEEFLRIKNLQGRAGDYTFLMTWMDRDGHKSRVGRGEVFTIFWQNEQYSDIWSSGWIYKDSKEYLDMIGSVDKTQDVLELTKDITWIM